MDHSFGKVSYIINTSEILRPPAYVEVTGSKMKETQIELLTYQK